MHHPARVGDTDARDAASVEGADGESVPVEDDGIAELRDTLESVQQKTCHRVVRTCRQHDPGGGLEIVDEKQPVDPLTLRDR